MPNAAPSKMRCPGPAPPITTIDQAVAGTAGERDAPMAQAIGDARAPDAHRQRGHRVRHEESAHDLDVVLERERRHERHDAARCQAPDREAR